MVHVYSYDFKSLHYCKRISVGRFLTVSVLRQDLTCDLGLGTATVVVEFPEVYGPLRTFSSPPLYCPPPPLTSFDLRGH